MKLPQPLPGTFERIGANDRMSISLRSRRGYLICSGARTGSNLLSDSLRQTRVAGNPKEYFNAHVQRAQELNRELGCATDEVDTDPVQWFGRVLSKGTSSNGVFGAKVHGTDLVNLVATLRSADIDGIHELGSEPTGRAIAGLWESLDLVRIRRQNAVARAISHLRAVASEVWYLPKNNSRPDGRDRTPDYNYDAIRKWMQLHREEERLWDTFLSDFPRPILSITYEDLVLDPIGITARTLDHLGLYSRAAEQVQIRSLRQADDLSLEWEERFVAEQRERGEGELTGAEGPPDASKRVHKSSLSTVAVAELARAPGLRRRICLVSREIPGLFRNGGIGTAMGGLAEAMARADAEVSLLFVPAAVQEEEGFAAALKREQARYAGMGVVLTSLAVAKGAGNDPRWQSLAVYRFLREQAFDCVVFAENCGLGYYALEAKRTGCWEHSPRLIVVAHGPGQWVRQLNGTSLAGSVGAANDFLERRSVELADVLVSPSRYLIDWMSAQGWRMAADTRVMQNILPAGPLAGNAARAAEQTDELVFFGRQETRKGLGLFCDAIDQLNAAMPDAKVRVTVLGKFDEVDGVHSGVYLANRMRPWRFATRVISTFGQAEAIAYLCRPGVLAVMPSLAENSPCVVAECIASGIPFVATASGGTAELVADEDRGRCLVMPEAGALSDTLGRVLREGQVRIRPAIPAAQTEAAWADLLVRHSIPAGGKAAADTAASLLSICIVGSPKQAAASLDSLAQQTSLNAEIILVDNSDGAVDHFGIEGPYPLRVVAAPGADLAAARNAAAELAKGDALLFAEPHGQWLDNSAVSDFWRAHRDASSDITVSLPSLEPSDSPASLPVGACASLCAVENCVGEAPFVVSAAWFRQHGGFPAAEASVLDWIYLARAVHAGASCAVVPRQLVSSKDVQRVRPDSRGVDRARVMIARAIGAAGGDQLGDTIEFLLLTRRGTHDVATAPQPEVPGLTLSKPNGAEAERAFVDYCFQQHLIDLAVDFALINGVETIAPLADAAGKALARTALRWFAPGHLRVSHRLDLTQALRDAIGGAETTLASAFLEQPAGALAGVVRIRNGCPPGLLGLTVRAALFANTRGRQRYAIALVEAGSPTPVLTEQARGRFWSGWVECTDDPSAMAVLKLPEARAEPADLVLMAEPANGDTSEGLALRWTSAAAELEGVGPLSLTAFHRQYRVRPVSAQTLLTAQLLTDVGSFPYPVLVPGLPLRTHPIPAASILVRAHDLVPPGARGIRCKIVLEHEKARPVDFNVYLAPTSDRLSYPATAQDLTNFVASSGWATLAEPCEEREVLVLLDRPAEAGFDVYLSVRPTDGSNVDFALASWHEFGILD